MIPTDVECVWSLFEDHVEPLLTGRASEGNTQIFISVVQLRPDIVQCDVFIAIALKYIFKVKVGVNVPFNSQGHIGTGPQY